MARTTPLFSNFLFANLFSIKFRYFFIISSLFPYLNLFVSIFIQSYVNIKLHVSTLYRYKILYKYWHEQVQIRKKTWNNKEIKNFIENKFVNRKLEKKGMVRATCDTDNLRRCLVVLLKFFGLLCSHRLLNCFAFHFWPWAYEMNITPETCSVL